MDLYKTHIAGKRFAFLVLTGLVLQTRHSLLFAAERQHQQPFEKHTDVTVEDCLECMLDSASSFESVESVTCLTTNTGSFLKPAFFSVLSPVPYV